MSGKVVPGTAFKKKHLSLLFPFHKASLNTDNCGAVNKASAGETWSPLDKPFLLISTHLKDKL